MTEQDNRQTPQRGAVGRRPVSRRPVQGRAPVRNNSSVQDARAAEHSSHTGQEGATQDSHKHSVTPAARRTHGVSSSSKPVSSNIGSRNQNQGQRKASSSQESSLSTSVDNNARNYHSFLSDTDENSEINERPKDRDDSVESNDRWVTDAKTGVKHKELSRIPKNVLSAMHKVAKSGGTPSSSELKFIPREKDFDSIDAFTGAGMDAMAETFLGHLRVPPNEEELKRLREEYARRQQKAAEDYQHEQDEIMSTSGDDNLTYF